ncbi:MAG: DUF4192 family protein [Actinobacteria bacterium]|nr:DUF4192 family protein [Actinomycetota bacterium]
MLRCTTTADFLAALPFLAGFTAQNSLFLVLFSGKRANRAIRMDLPDPDDARASVALLDGICELLSETGAGTERPAVVISSSQSFAEAGGAPWREFARLLRRRFRREGWSLRELAVVAPDAWTGLLDPEAPRHGRSLNEIAASPVGAQAAEAVPAPRDIDRFGELSEPDAERAAAVLGRLAELDLRERRRASAAEAQPDQTHALVWVHGLVRVASACFTGTELPEPRLAARLIAAAEVPDRWLVLALVTVCTPEFVTQFAEDLGPARLADSAQTSSSGIGRILAVLAQSRPDPTALHRIIDVLGDTAAHAPSARRAGLLALLAWAWWLLGMSSVADRLLRDAGRIDADHELTHVVAEVTSSPPGWLLADLGDEEHA